MLADFSSVLESLNPVFSAAFFCSFCDFSAAFSASFSAFKRSFSASFSAFRRFFSCFLSAFKRSKSSLSFSCLRAFSTSASRAAMLEDFAKAATALSTLSTLSDASDSASDRRLAMALSRSCTLAWRFLMATALLPESLSRFSLFLASHCHMPPPRRPSAFFQSSLSRALTVLFTGSADLRSSIRTSDARMASSVGLVASSNMGDTVLINSVSVSRWPAAR